jgi:hypothetical protein
MSIQDAHRVYWLPGIGCFSLLLQRGPTRPRLLVEITQVDIPPGAALAAPVLHALADQSAALTALVRS